MPASQREVCVRQRQRNFTIIYNNILNDRDLSLRARGLLCTVLSLPKNWDYSIAGLIKIVNPEDEDGNICPHLGQGKNSIYKILNELEELGYLVREQERLENGRHGRTIYTFFDERLPGVVRESDHETAGSVPRPKKRDTVKRYAANQTQLSTKDNQQLNQSITHHPHVPEPAPRTPEELDATIDDEALEKLCSMSLKPVARTNRAKVMAAWRKVLEDGVARAQIIKAYERYAATYRKENTSPRYALQLHKWFTDPRGLAWHMPPAASAPVPRTYSRGTDGRQEVWLVQDAKGVRPIIKDGRPVPADVSIDEVRRIVEMADVDDGSVRRSHAAHHRKVGR